MFDPHLYQSAETLVSFLKKSGLTISMAESCTGGLIAASITSIDGSSQVFDRSFVTYSNDAKRDMLFVSAASLLHHGAVSEQVAKEMAEGALEESSSDIALSVTGIAGPGGGTPYKPVGLVYMAVADAQGTKVFKFNFEGNRHEIRKQAALKGLSLLRTRTVELAARKKLKAAVRCPT